MLEIILMFLACGFLIVAISAALAYSNRIIRVKHEYEEVKETFNDIIISFSRELKSAMESLKIVTGKVNVVYAKSEEALQRISTLERMINGIEERALESNSFKDLEAKLGDIEKATRDIVASHATLVDRLSSLEKKVQTLLEPSEPSVEAVVPIRREKVFEPLTKTELAVLEMLAAEGPKTSPEIRERIRLSREHTARLMKKLYEKGYLERDSGKIPFRYSIKKEMENLLKKEDSVNSV